MISTCVSLGVHAALAPYLRSVSLGVHAALETALQHLPACCRALLALARREVRCPCRTGCCAATRGQHLPWRAHRAAGLAAEVGAGAAARVAAAGGRLLGHLAPVVVVAHDVRQLRFALREDLRGWDGEWVRCYCVLLQGLHGLLWQDFCCKMCVNFGRRQVRESQQRWLADFIRCHNLGGCTTRLCRWQYKITCTAFKL